MPPQAAGGGTTVPYCAAPGQGSGGSAAVGPPGRSVQCLLVGLGACGAALCLAALAGRRYLRYRRRRDAAGGQQDVRPQPATACVDAQQALEQSPPDHLPSQGAAGPAAPAGKEPLEGALRLGSAELSLLGGFFQESWRALTHSSGSGGGGGSDCASGGSAGRRMHALFDSAGSHGGGQGSGGSSRSAAGSGPDSRVSSGGLPPSSSGPLLTSQASGLTTDLTKLPEAWNVVNWSELHLARSIGEGSFGQVFLAKYCQTIVAVKVLNQHRALSDTHSMHERSMFRALSKEVSIMAHLRHPNCTQYLGVCLDPPALLMEYCSKRSVDSILSAAASDAKLARQLTWARLLGMACDAAKGMLYLHSRHPPILHRDLKSANLLVDAHWHVKVADFNLSRPDDSTAASTVGITNPRWLAPEVLRGGQAQLASDVFAFGTVMWELLTWRLPFEGLNPFQIITIATQAEEGAGLPIPGLHELPAGPFAAYPEYVALMKACWARNPSDRPTMDAVVKALLPMLCAELRHGSAGASGALGAATPQRELSMDSGAPLGGPSRDPSGSDCHGGTELSRAASVHGCGSGGSGCSEPSMQRRAGAGVQPMTSVAVAPQAAVAVERAASVHLCTPFAALAGAARADSLASDGQLDRAVSTPRRDATQELLDGGHCTVANAMLSQLNSGTPGYPFVNTGYFAHAQSELLE